MPAKLTIFTPSYNRAGLLPHGFEALKKQTCKDFVWMIIDDGSTDNTMAVVREFQNANSGFDIVYIAKENGGLHTGYNVAIENLNTELAMCIDSDDWIADDAVALILRTWETIRTPICGGIVAQDVDVNGKVMCHIDGEGYINLNQYDATHKWGGDRKLVIRSELYKKYAPMPSFSGEKNFNPQYLHIKIAESNLFYVLNQPICVVDYQETGMSAGIYRQFVNSPNSFAEYRRLQMTIKPNRLLYIAKNAIHYDSSCIIAGNYADIVLKSPKKIITTILAPLGWVLSIYVKKKARV